MKRNYQLLFLSFILWGGALFCFAQDFKMVGIAGYSTNLSSDKAQFVHSIITVTKHINLQIYKKQSRLIKLNQAFLKGQQLSRADREWLENLAKYYYVNTSDFSKRAVFRVLRRRVDVLPISLVVAQAVYESDWGQSRFAKVGNNYFGLRCYTKGCGLVPAQRPKEAVFEVKQFPNMTAAVQYYIHTLNTFKHYKKLRDLRYEQRMAGEPLDGTLLAAGLEAYAQQDYYIKAIQSIIKQYEFYRYD
ncbi:MAG: glucosaminidase domain-containing protein [Gammaproteobacteria bacterium]|nr:glucosaminidase domain-containing protein [Gammaproteobacteria bacterium]